MVQIKRSKQDPSYWIVPGVTKAQKPLYVSSKKEAQSVLARRKRIAAKRKARWGR